MTIAHACGVESALYRGAQAMTIELPVPEVLKLAPDEVSAKAARGLTAPAKWPRLGFDDLAVWGECQGSGSKPYQVQVDRNGPAFRCTCPSRKFPCKHGLALLLLLAERRESFAALEPPAWVVEWLASRQQRAEKQEQKLAAAAESREAPADPQAAARREAARRARMVEGLDELERWLADRLRQGLAQLPGQPKLWDEIAARMVDAQLPGLAWRLRRAGEWVGHDEAWPARLLGGLGQLQLLSEASRRLDTLPPPVQADLRTALGVVQDRDTVLAAGERLNDDWLVLGQSVGEEDRLWTRRVWLRGKASGRRALLLDYAHGAPRFEPVYLTGRHQRLTLAFYPGSLPLRALALEDGAPPAEGSPPPTLDLAAALDALATAVAANPWQWPQPLLCSDGVPWQDAAGWCLQTADGRRLDLELAAHDGWRLTAEAGGRPLTVFGEWDGRRLRPLGAWRDVLLWSAGSEAR